MSNDIRDRLQETAFGISATLPPGTGFVLLAFDLGAQGRFEYVSNARRDDVLKAMMEFVEKSLEDRDWGKGKHPGEGPKAPGEP